MIVESNQIIRLNNVSLYFGEDTVLNNVNWEISRGDKWILFGRNGSGKSKLLEIILGYHYSSSGEVYRFSDLYSDVRSFRRRAGYVGSFLKNMIYPAERAIDVVTGGLFAEIGLYTIASDADIEKSYSLIEKVGLLHRANHYYKLLSDGEKQKILAARAFITDPDIVFFDEPTAGLDIAAREDFLQAMQNLCSDKNHAVVFVTHHTEEILPVFDKVLMLNCGKVLYNGDIEGGINSCKLSELFTREIKIEKISGRYYSFVV